LEKGKWRQGQFHVQFHLSRNVPDGLDAYRYLPFTGRISIAEESDTEDGVPSYSGRPGFQKNELRLPFEAKANSYVASGKRY
jgi:hypothetical protein